MCVDLDIQNIINVRLRGLPHLSSIIPLCDSQTRLHFDQYGGDISLGRNLEVEESTIYEVLLGAQDIPQFETQVMRLEEMLSRHPEFCTPEFGRILIGSFFSRYSELEIFDALTMFGYVPDIDPLIAPRCRDSKKADFKIIISGTEVFIEVLTPRLLWVEEKMFRSEPVTGFYDPTVGIGNRDEEFHPVEYKIIQEYEHHFKIYEPQFNTPTIFVVDLTLVYSDTPGLFGTMDIQTLFARFSFSDYIVGILVYRTIYHRGTSTRVSTFYVNPQFSGIRAILGDLSRIMQLS